MYVAMLIFILKFIWLIWIGHFYGSIFVTSQAKDFLDGVF